MFVVAITRLATSVEQEAAALAADLGTTAYEERLRLVAGPPAIVLTTVEPDAATRLHASLRARGHGAVCFDASEVVGSEQMVAMRAFAFAAGEVTVAGPRGGQLPYDDILALVRAVHRTSTETVSQVADKKLSVGRAILTGGLVASRSVTRDETSSSHDRDQLLYLFRRSGQTPWLLRERGAQYTGLGAALAPTSVQNFATTIDWLRQRAPHALYDESLLKPRAAPTRVVHSGGQRTGSVTASTAGATDLLAHTIARAVAEGCWQRSG